MHFYLAFILSDAGAWNGAGLKTIHSLFHLYPHFGSASLYESQKEPRMQQRPNKPGDHHFAIDDSDDEALDIDLLL